jgi:hypothetical protein
MDDLYNHFDWTVISLLASFVAGAIPSLLLFYVGYRYETEFVTGILMLALIGFCQALILFRAKAAQKLVALIGGVLLFFSILANIALAFTGIAG